ncbi:MAG: leucine-rich repeat protein [Peptoniphilaceae bacterium]|nr:leucine-rich repeat protein [Peptoniphilaceae bacterium]
MKHKKALSLLLVFALTLTSIPASIFADTAPSDTVPIKPVVENGSDMTSDPAAPAVPSMQVPATAEGGGANPPAAPQAEPSDPGKIADESVLHIKNGTLYGFVEGYHHDGSAIVIPEGVTEIAPRAFEGIAISKVTLPLGLKTIGRRAFYAAGIHEINLDNVVELKENALSRNKLSGTINLPKVKVMEPYALSDNEIEVVNLGADLTVLGDFALADNKITAVNTLNSITELGAGALQNNKLSGEIQLPRAEKIGASAFEGNTIAAVTINDALKEMGKNVFARNGRYVVVTTKSPLLKNEESSMGFGHVLAGQYLEKVTIHFMGYSKSNEDNGKLVPDETSGKTIASSIVINSDFTKQGGVIYSGVERTYIPQSIPGYQPYEEVIRYTPVKQPNDGGNYQLNAQYMVAVDQPTIRVNSSVNFQFEETFTQEELLSRIKRIIEAKDKDNQDILDSVKIESFSLPADPTTGLYKATPKGFYEAVISATDKKGLVTTAKVSVSVGDDFGETIIGGKKKGDEWKVKHFIYSDDGTRVLGFSDLGKTKVTTDPDVYLPNISIQGKIITDIGEDFKFDPEADPMTMSESVEMEPADPDHNFAGMGIRSVVIPDTVRRIGQGMFRENAIRSLDIPDSVEWIDNYAFAGNPIAGDLVIPDSVKVIGHYAFYGFIASTLTVGSGAEHIGVYGFAPNEFLTDLHLKSNLKKVFPYAFANMANARNIDIDGYIEQIGTAAFYGLSSAIAGNGGAVSNNFDFREGIRKIGTYAFCSSGLREIVLPDNVEDIYSYAFESVPFTKIELGKNLHHIGENAFYQRFFSGSQDLVKTIVFRNPDPSELTPENELVIDSMAFCFPVHLMDQIEFPDNLVSLGEHVFSVTPGSGGYYDDFGVKRLILPADMRQVGSHAFSSFPVTESVIFKKPVPGQTIRNELTIGDFAFTDRYTEKAFVKEVQLPENLVRIEACAFLNAQLNELILPEKLKEIGDYAFIRNDDMGSIEKLVIPPSVTAIGDSAFQNQGIGALTLNEGLETIGSSAFRKNAIESVTFPSTLKIIGGNAFESNQLTAVSIPGTVKSIQSKAFQNNRIESLELKEGVQSIKRDAFKDNQLKTATIPSTVQTIEEAAFQNNPGNGYKPYVNDERDYSYVELMVTGDKADQLPGEQRNSYVIHPRRIILHYVDTAGKALREDEVLDLSGISEYTTDPRLFLNHTPPKPETVPLTEAVTEITLTYTPWDNAKEQEVQRVSNAIGLTHTGLITKESIGRSLRTRLQFNMQGYDDISNYKDLQIHILLPDSVDPDKIEIPPSNLITKREVKNGVLVLSLASVASASQLELPIEWKLKRYETPADTPQPLNTVLVSGGEILAQAAPVSLEGTYPAPMFSKSVVSPFYNGLGMIVEKKLNELVPVGDGFAKKDDNTITYSFYYRIERNLSHVKLTDRLPSYIDKEGKTVKMGFDAAKNPGWRLEGEQLIYEADIQNRRDSSISNLILEAPGALLDKPISNTASVELTPYHQGSGESIQKATSGTSFRYSLEKRDFNYGKRVTNARGSSDPYIYDIQEDRDKELTWELYAHTDKLIKDIHIVDSNLDSRLYYSGVSFSPRSNFGNAISFSAKNAAGEVLQEGKLESSKLTFDEAIAKEIASIEFTGKNLHADTTDYDLADKIEITLCTKFRDPSRSAKNGRKLANSADISFELWENSTLKKGKSFSDKSTVQVAVEDVENRFFPTKSSSVPADSTIYAGKTLTYTLGYSSAGGKHGDSVIFMEDLKNIQLIDVLPKGIELKNVRLDPEFVKLEDAGYKVEENYQGTGQTAVIFTAKSSSRKQMAVAGLDVYIEPIFDTTVIQDNLINKAYLKFDESATNKLRNKDKDGFSTASTSNTVMKAKELFVRKYIAKGTERSDTGLYTKNGEDFRYQIKVYNALDNGFGYLEVIDVLPIVGDSSFYTTKADKVPRESQFSNIIRSVDTPAGFTAYYLNQDEAVDYSHSLKELSANGNWEPIMKSNVKAIKFVSTEKNFSFDSNGVYTFTIHATAPEDSALNAKRANNSCMVLAGSDAAKAAAEGKYMESNRVYNEITRDPFNILFKKFSVTQEDAAKGDYSRKKPLEGASFRLFRIDEGPNGKESLTPVASAKSDAEGNVKFTSIPMSFDYEVREISADGYQVPDKGIRISKDAVKGANYPDYNLGEFVNLPNPKNQTHRAGVLQFKKVDGDGKPLAGIGFRLTRKKPYVSLNADSDADGMVRFNISPEKVYEDTQNYNNVAGKVYTEFQTQKVINELSPDSSAVQKALEGSILISDADYRALPTGEYTQTVSSHSGTRTAVYKKQIIQKRYKMDYGTWTLTETKKPYLFKGMGPVTTKALTEEDFQNGPYAMKDVVNDKLHLQISEILLSGAQAEEFIGAQDDSGAITAPATKPLTQLAKTSGTPLPADPTPDPVTGEDVDNTAKFNLYKEDGTIVLKNIATTNFATADMDIPTSLLGENLYLKQVQAPGSAFLNPARLEFRINDRNITDWEGNVYSNVFDTLLFPNARKSVKSEILVKKTGQDASAPSPESVALPGAEFTLYRKENIRKDESGNEIGFDWVQVDSKVTDDQGKAKFDVYSGEFKLQETKAPEGYLLDPKPYYFTKSRYNPLNRAEVNSLNYKLRIMGIDVESFLENDTRDQEAAVRLTHPELNIAETVEGRILGKVLPNATVEVTVDGKSQGQFTSDSYGRYDFSKLDLKTNSKVTIQQLTAPEGYHLNDKKITVDLSRYMETGRKTRGIFTIPVRNNKSFGSVTIAKYDNPFGRRLAGAEFTLYNSKDQVVGEAQTTDKMGVVSWLNLDLKDSYYVKETKTPAGYQTHADKIPVVFDANNHFLATVYDRVFDVVVSVKTPDTKDENGNTVPGTPVPNTVVTIKDSDGNVVGKFPVDKNGQVHIENLDPFGKYTLEQTTPNPDYAPITSPISFVPTKLKTLGDGNYDLPVINRQYVSLIVVGKDQDTNKLIPGTKVRLVDGDGKVVEEKTADESGKIVFTRLDDRKTYKTVLVETPEGYYQSQPQTEQTVDLGTMQKDADGNYSQEYLFRSYADLKVNVLDKNTQKAVQGSTISLLDAQGNVIDTKVIEKDEDSVTFTGLEREKTYQVRHDQAAESYIKEAPDTAKIVPDQCTPNENGEYSHTFFVRTTVSLIVVGKDQDTNKLIPGTKVRLIDGDGKVVEEKTADASGRITFCGLDGEKAYKLILVKNPAGYYQSQPQTEQDISFAAMEADENGNFTKELTFRSYGSLKVDVKDKSSGKNVKGSVIVLTDEEGNLIAEKTIQGEKAFVVFEGLEREKTYFVYEKSVPAGYFEDPQDGHVRIVLDKAKADAEGIFGYTFFVTQKHTPGAPASPKTGDVRGMISMTALFVVAIVFLVGSLKKRKQNR